MVNNHNIFVWTTRKSNFYDLTGSKTKVTDRVNVDSEESFLNLLWMLSSNYLRRKFCSAVAIVFSAL